MQINTVFAGLAVILVAVVLVYSNTLTVPFVFDDLHSIVENEARRSVDFSFDSWFSTRTVPYHTFDLNYYFHGLEVAGYHVVNIAVHVLAGWAVWWLVSGLLAVSSTAIDERTRYSIALLAALIFVLHPIQTQAVTYIVQRLAAMATLFYAVSLAAFVQFRRSKSRHAYPWAGLSLCAAILAMHSKEIAVTLPVAILFIEGIFFGIRSTETVARRVIRLLPWMLVGLIIPLYMFGITDPYRFEILGGIFRGSVEVVEENGIGFDRESGQVTPSTVRSLFKPVSAETQKISRWTYLLTEINVVRTYVRLVVLPVRQNLDYDYPLSDQIDVVVVLSFLLHATLIGLAAYLFFRKRKLAAFGIMFFYLGLSVESSVFPITDVIFEHRLYLPMLGVVCIVADGLLWLVKRFDFRLVTAASAIVLVCLGFATYARNRVWANEISLWGDVVQKSPEKARGLNNLGMGRMNMQDFEEAEDLFLRAQEADTDNVEAAVNLGSLYGRQGRLKEAKSVLLDALRESPQNTSAMVNLGNVYQQAREFVAAEDIYRQALQYRDSSGSIWASLGDALIGQNKMNEAMGAYEEAVVRSDAKAEWFNRLGALYANAGRFTEAEEMFREALDRDPTLLVAQQNLDRLLREQ